MHPIPGTGRSIRFPASRSLPRHHARDLSGSAQHLQLVHPEDDIQFCDYVSDAVPQAEEVDCCIQILYSSGGLVVGSAGFDDVSNHSNV